MCAHRPCPEERGTDLVWGLGYEHLIANGALRIGYEEIANVDPGEDDLRLIAFDVLLRFDRGVSAAVRGVCR